MSDARAKRKFRSQEWFDNPNNPGMTALYIERYLNQEYTREELQSERPIIGMHVRRGDACHTSLRKGRCEGAAPHAAV